MSMRYLLASWVSRLASLDIFRSRTSARSSSLDGADGELREWSEIGRVNRSMKNRIQHLEELKEQVAESSTEDHGYTLTEEEIDRLRCILARAPSVKFSSIEGLDGTLAAIACSPLIARTSDVVNLLYGHMNSADSFVFESPEEKDEFENLVLYYLFYVHSLIAKLSDSYAPKIDDGFDRGLIWASGFVFGMDLTEGFWNEMQCCRVLTKHSTVTLGTYAMYMQLLASASESGDKSLQSKYSTPKFIRDAVAKGIRELVMLLYHNSLYLKFKYIKQ